MRHRGALRVRRDRRRRQPTWVDYSGGDTLLGRRDHRKGGLRRWSPALDEQLQRAATTPARVRSAPGARQPLDLDTGMPMPGTRAVCPAAPPSTRYSPRPAGLWVGSDTDYIGNYKYKRPKLAFFPLAGGAHRHADQVAALPGERVPRRSADLRPGQRGLSGQRRRRSDRRHRWRTRLDVRSGGQQSVPHWRCQHRRMGSGRHDGRHRPGEHARLGIRRRALVAVGQPAVDLDVPGRTRGAAPPGSALLRQRLQRNLAGGPADLRRHPGRAKGPRQLRHRGRCRWTPARDDEVLRHRQ